MPQGPVEPSPSIRGVHQIALRSFADDRGFFFETFRRTWIPETREMVQGNCSFSRAGVLRGLHYHLKQADLWCVPVGHVRAVLYDFRTSSPTRGAWQRVEMGQGEGAARVALFIPPGVAHGFYALADSYMTYLVDEYYDNSDELGILCNDPALGIDWGVRTPPSLSDRDQKNLPLAEIPTHLHPP
jgi:dTDP-4-dehydrorhamnose 3,5-epimerase